MLIRLEIHNYAIIDTLRVDFGPGLNILTGETGAGKSIIIGALNLLLGGRMTAGILRKGVETGYVEGIFDLTRADIDLPADVSSGTSSDRIVVKREFSETGGNKSYINGKTATLSAIKSLFEKLVDLHGQHQHQTLLYTENYYELIDRYGNLSDTAHKTSVSFAKIASLRQAKRELERTQTQLVEMRDYMTFQLKEIQEVDPQPGEEESLEKEMKLLQNAEKIVSLARDGYRLLYDDEHSALTRIQSAKNAIDELGMIDSDVKDSSKDLESAAISVEEAAQFLRRYSDKIESNPVRLEELNQRLMTIQQLQKKYKTDVQGILEKKEELERDLKSEESVAGKIRETSEAIAKETASYGNLAERLSQKRSKTAQNLCDNTVERLKLLGMKNSVFEIVISKRKKHDGNEDKVPVTVNGSEFYGDEKGIDNIEFLIATGRSESKLPISQIASGGELSRLMLALKGALMKADHVPTLVFDEIDSGISGRIAAAVGKELHTLSEVHQILCITHLPQIACMADDHFTVSKEEHNGRIVTRITKLRKEERKYELAQLIAGDTVKDSHIKSAEELLHEE